MTEVAHILGSYAYNLKKKMVGQHFGRFKKLIRSPWSLCTHSVDSPSFPFIFPPLDSHVTTAY
jgi:hypothetical protein